MRQWKTTLLNEYVLDDRDREDILNKMKELAASYTPEWQLDTENPDIGSCIALLYSDEMQELIKRYNMIPERNCVELVNMLQISLKAAYPAQCAVLMNIVEHTVPGIKLQKGIKLIAENNGDVGITFETANTVYLTNAKLKTALMTSGVTGKVYPIQGVFPELSYLEKSNIVQSDQEENVEAQTFLETYDYVTKEDHIKEKMSTFRLFDFDRQSYGLYGTLLYHSHLFDVQNNDIVMELQDGEEIVDGIIAGDYALKYWGQKDFIQITDIEKDTEGRLVFRKSEPCGKIVENEKEYSVLLIEPKKSVMKNLSVSQIGFSSEGKPEPLTNIWNGTYELNQKNFQPFGEALHMYAELYIMHQEYFTKPGALVTLQFQLEYGTHMVSVNQQEEEQLKIIKRKQRRDIYGVPAEVYADEVVLEYYNGIGWKKLETTEPIAQLFQMNKTGRCQIEFISPMDWKEVEEGSSVGNWLRIRLLKADNCYHQPALHHYPIVKNMMISYSYEHHMDTPQKIICFQGSRKKDVTIALAQKTKIPMFLRNPYNTTSLYLGLDKRLEDGPVSILIDIDSMEGFSGQNLKYYYSTRDGFSRLKLVDNTNGLERTGTLVFIPPTDMAEVVIEGERAYWIRITDEKQELEDKHEKCPTINNIYMNAVEVNNIDTLEEQDYYIDMFGPDMSFSLYTDGILDADIWVNEVDHFTENEMRIMLKEQPTTTRADYNLKGGIEAFYIKWEEVEHFEYSLAGDRHYVINRQNHTILFGDGIHVRIPKNTKGIAFKAIVRRCEGAKANVSAGEINASMNSLLFVNDISNPMPAYGGMDMENLNQALRRGATQLGSRNRLISVMDYEREVLNFSDHIIQTKVVVDRKKNMTSIPGSVSIVLLMDDFHNGSNSFQKMKKRLKEHLLSKCELSIDEEHFELVQPLFVEISVHVWVSIIESDDSFDMQQHLLSVINRYLDPIQNTMWNIGRMVSQGQMEMQLNIEKGSAVIERVMMSAAYKDENGRREVDIESLQGNPYVLVMNGEHKIHFL